MKHKTSELTTSTRVKLVKHSWTLENARATLLIVHGYSEHAGRYAQFAEDLNKEGIQVYSYDQRGYGLSEGLRAYVDRFEEYVNDLDEVIQSIPQQELYLMGHSMGGLVASQYCISRQNRRVRGLISASALLALDPKLSPILKRLAPIIGAIFPKLATEKLDKTYLTRNDEARQAYMSDPLIYFGGTRARVGAEFLSSIKWVNERFDQIKLPLLALHGSADRLTMPNGTEKLYKEAASEDKTLYFFEGLYHELIHEPERDEVIEMIAKWIIERA